MKARKHCKVFEGGVRVEGGRDESGIGGGPIKIARLIGLVN